MVSIVESAANVSKPHPRRTALGEQNRVQYMKASHESRVVGTRVGIRLRASLVVIWK